MGNILSYIYEYILNFNAWYILFTERLGLVYLILFIMSVWGMEDYLGTLYSVKKSEKAMKIIAKQYNIIQRFLLIHYYQNVYKKVDRLYFNFVYKAYIFNLCLFFICVLSVMLSLRFAVFNQISCIILIFHAVIMLLSIIIDFFATRCSPLGGREYRVEAKYRGKKNW